MWTNGWASWGRRFLEYRAALTRPLTLNTTRSMGSGKVTWITAGGSRVLRRYCWAMGKETWGCNRSGGRAFSANWGSRTPPPQPPSLPCSRTTTAQAELLGRIC